MNLQSHLQILLYWAGMPNQHLQTNRLYNRMRIGAEQAQVSRGNRERFLAPGYRCGLLEDWLRRCSSTALPNGAPFGYKGGDFYGGYGNQRAYVHRWGEFRAFSERRGPDRYLSPSGTIHEFDGDCKAFLVSENQFR